MSAWDEARDELHPGDDGEGSTGGEVGGAATARARLDDGFDDVAAQEDAPADSQHQGSQYEDIEAERPKKKGLNPKLVMVALGAVAMTLVGAFAWKASQVLMARKGPGAQSVAVAEPMPVDAGARAPATILGSEASGAEDRPAAPLDAAPVTAAAAVPEDVRPESAPPAPAAVAAATPPAAAPVSTDAAAATAPVVAGLVEQVQQLRREVQSLRGDLDRQAARPAGALTRGQPHPPATTARPAASPTQPREAEQVRVAAARETVTPPEVVHGSSASTRVLPNMRLRGVYPPTGDDRQAWVLLGDSVQIVARGSVVGGATVLRIDSDQVLTDKGAIR